jgi:hypothetical protein
MRLLLAPAGTEIDIKSKYSSRDWSSPVEGLDRGVRRRRRISSASRRSAFANRYVESLAASPALYRRIVAA